MLRRTVALYFVVISIPTFLSAVVWQSMRFGALEREIATLEAEQEEWIESNKKLIAGIAVLSSSERIEYIATHDLGLVKIRPENVLQIRIAGEKHGRQGYDIDG
ncbi:cell division protein FtsL [Breznakiellaceae bacterium SP9]